MRALRAENARLEARIEKLEQARVLAASRTTLVAPATASPMPAPAPRAASPATSSMDALPPLTVVKLKPRQEAAPRISTAVEVEEPAESIIEDLKGTAAAKAADGGEPDEADLSMADAQFERALTAMKTGNSEGGVAQMQQFVTDWPRNPKADNALYFSGLALMAEKDFEHAAGYFERVLAQYPAGDAVLDSMLKLAECRLKLNRPREAKATWEKIVSSFPGTAAASQAQARLASLSASSP
jgi:tol-pal system protein YbgF